MPASSRATEPIATKAITLFGIYSGKNLLSFRDTPRRVEWNLIHFQ
jgi:hypothetical protein